MGLTSPRDRSRSRRAAGTGWMSGERRRAAHHAGPPAPMAIAPTGPRPVGGQVEPQRTGQRRARRRTRARPAVGARAGDPRPGRRGAHRRRRPSGSRWSEMAGTPGDGTAMATMATGHGAHQPDPEGATEAGPGLAQWFPRLSVMSRPRSEPPRMGARRAGPSVRTSRDGRANPPCGRCGTPPGYLG